MPASAKSRASWMYKAGDIDVIKSVDERLAEISKILKTLITEDLLDQKLDKLGADIKREYTERIGTLEERVGVLEEDNEDLKSTVSKLEAELEITKDKLHMITGQQNDLEQHGRKNSLRITGLKDPGEKESVEDCVNTIVDFVRNSLKVHISESDIDIAHRLGNFNKSTPRNIIVKFTHRRKKHESIRARRLLKGSKIVIFEDLTRFNQQRLKNAYHMKCVKNSYSMEGKLFVILQNRKKRKLPFDTPLEESYLLNDANFVTRK